METPELEAEKAKQKSDIGKAIELQVGRPAVNAKEERKRAALADMLAGDPISEVERRYAVAQEELNRYMKQVFPTDQDRFEFLEQCLLTNAALAGAKFAQTFGELTAKEAASAMAVFAKAAVDVRKAREVGFKEPPINVGVIINLQETLNKLANGNKTES